MMSFIFRLPEFALAFALCNPGILDKARVARMLFPDFPIVVRFWILPPFPHATLGESNRIRDTKMRPYATYEKQIWTTLVESHKIQHKSIILLSFLRLPQMTFSEDPNVEAELGNGGGRFESDPRPPLGSRGHFQG